MTVYVAPGATFEANVSGATTGQTGTIGVRISNLATHADFLARTTAGITEYPASSGIYARSFTAPTAAGSYSIIWDLGSPPFADEDLIVTSSALIPSVPSGDDLTTLADVRTALRIPVADTDQDDLLQQLITAASEHLIDAYNREFAPAGTVETRSFTYRGGVLDLSPGNAQAGLITAVVIDADQAATTTLVEATDWFAMPVDNKFGVVDYLRIPTQPVYGGNYRQVNVTATWGYPAIPNAASNAAIWTVMDWYRTMTSRPSGFNQGEDFTLPGSDVAIPQRARWLLRSFERVSIL